MATPQQALTALEASRTTAGAAYVSAVAGLVAAYKELAALDRAVTAMESKIAESAVTWGGPHGGANRLTFNMGSFTVPCHAQFFQGTGANGPFTEAIQARQQQLFNQALAA